MRELPNIGRLCPFAKECPVYHGRIQVEDISLHLIKNVFCNRGKRGWMNCNRYRIAIIGDDIPAAATPYHPKVKQKINIEKVDNETERELS